jgi:hypothetical protein
MGAWGAGIFANDVAADVRGEWRDAIAAGEDPAAASARIVAAWRREPHAAAWATDFWTGLAAAQMETGRLQDDVRDRALEVIAAGGDLELWEEGGPAAARSRRRALNRLAERLRGPQPAPKRLRRRAAPPDAGVERGDVLRIDAPDGSRSALFAVVHLGRDRNDPILLALDWRGGEVPGPERLATLPSLCDSRLTPGMGGPLEVASPILLSVLVATPADAFGPHVGAVVARGIRRPHEGLAASPATFAEIAELVGSSEFERLLARSARARSLPSAAAALATMLERSGVDTRAFGIEPD